MSKTKEKTKLYKTTLVVAKPGQKDLLDYCEKHTKAAKLFKNAVTYRCRQLYFAFLKGYTDLNDAQNEVLDEFKQIGIAFPISKNTFLPGYKAFDDMFKKTKNPDYYNELPMQSSQHIIKSVLEEWKSFRAAFFDQRKNPSKYTGKPKAPGYVDSDKTTFTITNQDAVIKNDNTLKLPKTKTKLQLGNLKIGKLIEIEIKPYYNTYQISLVEEMMETQFPSLCQERAISLDLGVDNFVAASNNCGLTPFVINGKKLKSYNQWYNKILAKHKSHCPTGQYTSKKVCLLNKHHKHFTTNFYNQCASYIMKYCQNNNIGTIVIGKNTYWKQRSNMGNKTNQTFCFIAHSIFINKIKEMAAVRKIHVIITEESYTSKASFLDGDVIPVYRKDHKEKHTFSGKRVYRGLYKSKNNIIMNADINGASNILRKALPDAFVKVNNFDYLWKTTEVVNI